MSKPFDPYKYIHPYTPVHHYADDRGHIVWRMGTGENCELLHIAAYEKRKGVGTDLVRIMVESLKDTPPYAEVFGFTLPDNSEAHAFYRSLGFTLSFVTGVYKVGKAVVFSQPYEKLVERFSKK